MGERLVRTLDRERVLAFLWLVGGMLTLATLVLPYDVEIDEGVRTGIAVLAFGTGAALLFVPPLPDWALHGVLALGTAAIAVCTSLGVPDVEGVMFLLPVLYAFATFPRSRAVPYLVAASALYGVILARADMDHVVAPWVSWTLVTGVATTTAFAVAALVELREREREVSRRDRRIAEVLQRTLLPQSLEAPPGTTLAAEYVPAFNEADVGGDFYDVLELPGARIALAIGDVAGKGLPAAAVVGRVRAALRAYAVEEPSPASVLERLDELLSAEPDLSSMTTLLYVLVDLSTGSTRFASAAHPAGLVLPADGEPRFLECRHGPPLGARIGGMRSEGALDLRPGDGLLLFTDGIVERRGEIIDAGFERLRATIAAAGGDAAARLAAALKLLPQHRPDDVALLAFTFVPVGDHLSLRVPRRAEALAPMRAAVRRWVDGRFSNEAADDLLLAVSEAAANAVTHGGASGEPFHVEATLNGGHVHVRVRDTGHWRRPAAGGDGHGLTIMDALAERVQITTGEEGTTIELEHRVGYGDAHAAELHRR